MSTEDHIFQVLFHLSFQLLHVYPIVKLKSDRYVKKQHNIEDRMLSGDPLTCQVKIQDIG